MSSVKSRALVYAHFDKDNMVDDYVVYNLKQLRPYFSKIVFVSVSDLSDTEIKKLSGIADQVLMKKNEGYDFFSYKLGLNELRLFENPIYDELVLMNDSVYGPFQDLQSFFDPAPDADFWGMTDSFMMFPHLQSYFLVFKKNVYLSDVFKSFWSHLKIYSNRFDIVYHYEITLSKVLTSAGFKMFSFYKRNSRDRLKEISFIGRSIFPFFLKKLVLQTFKGFFSNSYLQERPYLTYPGHMIALNPTHDHFESVRSQIPYIKISYLKENPFEASSILDGFQGSEKETLIPIIQRHLQRILKPKIGTLGANTIGKMN